MGGSGSGRRRTRNAGALNGVPRLDIRQMRRCGLLRPGVIMRGTCGWMRRGEDLGSVRVRVDLADHSSGVLTVTFKLNGEPRRQEVAISSRPMRFGGRRYYFQCPETLKRCEVLALTEGAFASRRAHRLTYSSQGEGPLARLSRRAERLRMRLWPDGRRGARGDNRRRLAVAWVEATATLDEYMEAALRQLEVREAIWNAPEGRLGRREVGLAASPPNLASRRGRPRPRRAARGAGGS